jgi:DUF1365 family protein
MIVAELVVIHGSLSLFLIRLALKDMTTLRDLWILLISLSWYWAWSEWQHIGVIVYASVCLHLDIILTILFSPRGRRLGFYQTVQSGPFPGLWPFSGPSDSVFSGRLKPEIIPSTTTHSRLFPRNHSFSYPYLLVGIPIGWKGHHGNLISVDLAPGQARSHFHVDAADHLAREDPNAPPSPRNLRLNPEMHDDSLIVRLCAWILGHHEDVPPPAPPPKDLKTKLTEYLYSQGVQATEWKEAYLVTAPSVLRYTFNPVSFWYIYGLDDRLSMMILEVNNTFDERRMYLLKSDQPESQENTDDDTTALTFNQTWNKDFHVSPFNSRKGSYTLKASDPFANPASIKVSNTITLLSSKSHPKLVARVFSTAPAIDPQELGRLQRYKFLWSHTFTGFLTFPRILYQAAQLYFAHGLNVWYRPEVQQNSIGRRATHLEKDLEPFFAAFLADLVQRSESPLKVTYHAACNRTSSLRFSSPVEATGERPHLQFHVLSPAFYSRLIHYTRFSEALDHECLFTDSKNSTLWISDPSLLTLLAPSRVVYSTAHRSLNPILAIKWQLLRLLHAAPPAQAYPDPSNPPSDPAYRRQDIRPSRLSDLDLFVQSSCTRQTTYCNTSIRQTLADRFCGGFQGLLNIADLCFRAGLVRIAKNALFTDKEINFFSALFLVPAIWSLHIWAFLKIF